MKTKVQRLWSLCLINCVFVVNFVDSQFTKGVVRNNVFTHYLHNTSGSSDYLNRINQSKGTIDYSRNYSSTIMTTPLPYSTLAAIKPTTSVHKPIYHIKKPQSSPWNQTDHRPVIAYTLPPNMKVKLENAVRRVSPGSRTKSRSTKMNSATTPGYGSTELNEIIIKNFIQHLSTTKSDIESTIPNPNQFYTTPSSEGNEIEPPVIVSSNQFFPIGSMNTEYHPPEGIKQEEEHADDESPPILISSPTNPYRSSSIHHSVSQISPNSPPTSSAVKFPTAVRPHKTPNPSLHTATKHHKVKNPSKKESQQSTNPSLPTPIKSRPVQVHSNNMRPQQAPNPHRSSNRKKIVKLPNSSNSQQSPNSAIQPPIKSQAVDILSTMVPQQSPQPVMYAPTQNVFTTTISPQPQSPVILTPNQENSINVFNSMIPYQQSYPLMNQRNPVNNLNPLLSPQAINQVINRQPSPMFNSIPLTQTQSFPLQHLGNYNQTLSSQAIPMTLHPNSPTQDLASNRPNNSLKQLQLQFLLDCNLMDPLTKTRIPLGTNPVGDDFFFTPMPFTNHNPPQAPINLIQTPQIPFIPLNPFNPLNWIPGFPQTTSSPLTTIVLTEQHPSTQTTQQPIHVSIQPSQNSHRRRHRKKVKNVYVDLPIVSEVGNMLDKVYNFMEESLVTKVVKKTETQPPRRVHVSHGSHNSQGSYVNQNSARPGSNGPSPQVIYVSTGNHAGHSSESGESSDEDYSQRFTTPYYRTTRSRKRKPTKRRPSDTYYTNRLPSNNWQPINYHRMKRTTLVPNYGASGDKRKNYMTTKIHVTSEYNGPDPTGALDYDDDSNRRKVTQPDSSEEDDYYYDSLTFDGLNLDTGTYEDDDDEDDDDVSNSVQKDDYSGSAQKDESKSKETIKIKRKNSKQAVSVESAESDSYEDDDNDYYSPSMGMFGDFFGNMFSSMNKFVPSFGGYVPSFGGYFAGGTGSKEMDYNSIEREERSTTPKIETRNPKHPKYIFSDYADYNAIDNTDVGGSWYNPFYFGSNEITTTSPDTTTEPNNDYWNWFGNSNEKIDSTEDSTTNQNNTGWFFGLFGNNDEPKPTATTTTKRPFLTVENPMYKPHNWLGILANHLSAIKPSNNTPTNNTPTVSKKVSYDNYQLWRLIPESEDQVKFLEDYRITPEGAKLQWWKGPTLRGPTDIVIPPGVITDVKMSLDYEEIPHEVIIWDLEKAIKFENPPMSRREKLEMEITQEHPLSWYRYHNFTDIVKFLEYLQRKFSDSVELIHIGRSFEGRPLIVVKISAPSAQTESWKGKVTVSEKKKKKTNRRSIFIESGSHAREWITPAVSTWILDKLVQGLNRTDALGETIRSVDWYVLPILNPDGYEHSHQYDRLWKKSRSKHAEEPSLFSNALNWLRKDQKDKEEVCYGTDLNRNWDHNWNEKGSSKSKCNEFYAGPKAFSEPEVKALSKFLDEHKKHLKIYLSLHSYGQIISYPSQANASYNSIKSDDLLDMAQVALETLRGTGSSTRYIVDNTNEMMYVRSGSSDLYAIYDLGIKYSYTMELRDTGTHGFLLPPSNIESTAKETFEIIKGMVDYI